jgi:integrase
MKIVVDTNSVISRMFLAHINHCVYEREIISSNPADRISKDLSKGLLTRTSRKEDAERILNAEECSGVSRLLNELHEKNPDDVRPMAIMFAGILGCRLGEIVGLRWKCCRGYDKPEDAVLIVNDSMHYHYTLNENGKLSRKGEEMKGRTKTGKPRLIPMTDEIKAVLQMVADAQRCMGMLNPEFVFSDRKGQKTERSLSQFLIKRVFKPLGIQGKSMMTIRRTVASRMAHQTSDYNLIASILGHSAEVDRLHYQYDITGAEEKKKLISGL